MFNVLSLIHVVNFVFSSLWPKLLQPYITFFFKIRITGTVPKAKISHKNIIIWQTELFIATGNFNKMRSMKLWICLLVFLDFFQYYTTFESDHKHESSFLVLNYKIIMSFFNFYFLASDKTNTHSHLLKSKK